MPAKEDNTKWGRRDRKILKRKSGMGMSGRSVFTLNRLMLEEKELRKNRKKREINIVREDGEI